MSIPCYLSMTSAEFSSMSNISFPVGWLACHFSPSDSGLSNLPMSLPPDSLLIVDDSIPWQGHHSETILAQLEEAVQKLQPVGILLDFQRKGNCAVQEMVHALQNAEFCEIIIPPWYASDGSVLFLPPAPMHIPLEQYLRPYRHRRIWLDITPACQQISVSATGSSVQLLPSFECGETPHYSPELYCSYGIEIQDNQIVFRLCRNNAQLSLWIQEAEHLGVCGAVGLYQEFKK